MAKHDNVKSGAIDVKHSAVASDNDLGPTSPPKATLTLSSQGSFRMCYFLKGMTKVLSKLLRTMCLRQKYLR